MFVLATFSATALAVVNGTQLPAGQLNDSAVASARSDDGQTCSGTLLTNNWVVSAWHCRNFAPNSKLSVFYNQSCNPAKGDADCSARGAKCVSNYNGGFNCGAEVAQVYDSPDVFTGNQVNLWRLKTPIKAASTNGKWTIAQPVYFGSKSSLSGKNVTVLGTACPSGQPPWATLVRGTFKVSGFNTWSYILNRVGSYGIVAGDSGGPGYLNLGGTNVLIGTTVDGGFPCQLSSGSQHDLTEVQAWFDDTLFSAPGVLQSNVGGYAMGMNATGAVAAFNSGYAYYVTTCASEPCDARGAWTTPQSVLGTLSPAPAPAIAIDSPGAQIIIDNDPYPYGSGEMFAQGVAGNTSPTTFIGGGCASTPGASSRPGTNPPTIDVGCIGSDGNVWVTFRLGGAWRSGGLYSLGKPTSLVSTSPPAIVSTDANTTYVFVVATDGSVRYRIGVSGSGWGSWRSLQGGGVTRVAAASYASSRVDVIAVTSNGAMYHKFLDAGSGWAPNWLQLTKGGWSESVAPFAAAYSGDKARMNVGSVDFWNNAQVQRYSDW